MLEDYTRARKLGQKTYRKDRAVSLPALDEIIPEGGQMISLGLVEIPIAAIAGTKTKSRKNSFSSDFMPLLEENSEFAAKWSNLCDSARQEGIRDQIIVYEYLRKFYVQEGNKRVSVSRYLGAEQILANVTRVLPEKDGSEEICLYYEFVDFYQVCPLYDIEFSRLGDYARLSEKMGMDLMHVWSKDTVRDLAFAYHSFEKIFWEKGGQKLDMTAGDAFLVYLNVYGMQSLLEADTQTIRRQVSKVWNEILLAANGDEIDLVESPKQTPKESNPFSVFISQAQTKVYTAEDPLKVAFIYDGNVENSSWIYGHELGRLDLATRFHGAVDTIKFENCRTDDELRHAIDVAGIDEDAIIFTTSSGQMTETLKSAIHYPEIQFFNCSLNVSHNAVQTYDVRLYEAKFLLGVLAGSMAENHKIGYLADYPVYGSLANINAFAVGAALADPLVKIHLSWSATEENWRETFKSEGIHVISGPGFIQPSKASRTYGVYMIDDEENVTNLAVPVIHWGKYYEEILRPIVSGVSPVKLPQRKDQAVNYWWGMSAGVVDIILGNKVSYYSRKMVQLLKSAVIAGHLSPFDGELHSRDGIIKSENSARLSSREIITMDYLNDNVIGNIPKFEELTESGKRAVLVSGINNLQKGNLPS